MAAQEDLAVMAQTMNFGIEGVSIFAGREPDEVSDPAITFKNYGSGPLVKTMESRLPAIATPRVQVTARSKMFGDAQSIAEQLYAALFQFNTTINGNFYTMLEPMGEPIFIGPDPLDRQQIAFNVNIRRRN